MDKHALWKWLFLAVLICASMALVYPPSKKVKLGLDLKGGTSFTVQIDAEDLKKRLLDENPDLTEKEVDARLPGEIDKAREQALVIIRNRVDAKGIAEPLIYPEKKDRIVVQLPGLSEDERNDAVDLIRKAAFLEFAMVHEDNEKLTDRLFDKGLAPEGYVIAHFQQGGHEINCYIKDKKYDFDAETDEQKERRERFEAPRNYVFKLKEDIKNGSKYYLPYFVKDRADLSGSYLDSASVDFDQLGRPYVRLSFDAKGSKKFARITSDYAPGGNRNRGDRGRQLAIILDGTLYSAPVIRQAIYGGNASIEGNFTTDEAKQLAIVLRTGSLPAPVKIIEARSVDPSLGKDSIRSGSRAVIYSAVVVVLFMFAYYMLAGAVADVCLFFNILILPLGMIVASGFLSLFAGGAQGGGQFSLPVLTLPGIAGIALTIGMAVDANVLIFERIREEQNLGKRLGAAVEAGYDKAFVTIMDSNLTTIFTAIILFIFGSGPIRGFGVTLTAGILVSMFSALFVSRMFFNLIVAKTRIASLKMFQIIRDAHVNFIGWRKLAMTISLLMIVGSWGWFAYQAYTDTSTVLGVDFTGGSSITIRFDEKQPVAELRDLLAGVGIEDAHIQYQKELDSGDEVLQIRVAEDYGDTARNTVTTTFADAGFKVTSQDTLGPQIGSEMQSKAIKALIYSLIGMVIYISWRFEFAFAVGAIAALAHDVLISVGIYCLLGRQIGMPIVAALLAIVGYSVNDSIVVFDRIRENMRKKNAGGFLGVCNTSINETLGRTVLTSVTTLLAVIMLLVFGGGAINDFALMFLIGVVAGTYSSIFVATPVMIALRAWLKTPSGEKKG